MRQGNEYIKNGMRRKLTTFYDISASRRLVLLLYG